MLAEKLHEIRKFLAVETSELNSVRIIIKYRIDDGKTLEKIYIVPFKHDTGIQQYLDYYRQAFLHDHPEATQMKVSKIEGYHNDTPEKSELIYSADQKVSWTTRDDV